MSTILKVAWDIVARELFPAELADLRRKNAVDTSLFPIDIRKSVRASFTKDMVCEGLRPDG